MKKLKLPFPKLKYPLLCHILLYTPAVAMAFLPLALLAAFEEQITSVIPMPVTVIIILTLMILTIIMLIHDSAMFLSIEAYLSAISNYLKDRKCFSTDKNGKTRNEAEKYISGRMSRLGYTCKPMLSNPAPILIKYYSAFSWTIYYARIEKMCLLYSVDTLDMKLYSQIVTSVKTNTLHLHGDKSKMFFIDKQKKKAPLASAIAVVILADSVDEKVISAVRKNIGSYSDSVILPCVADISAGKYYFDACNETYMLGVMGKPMKNFAIDIIRKAVFGGRLPLRGNTDFTEFKNYDPDATLWDAIAEFRIDKEGRVPLIYRLLAKRIKAGQFKFIGNYIFCKIRKKTMAFRYELDKENEKLIRITLRKKSISDFGKNISKKELETLRSGLADFLESEGFEYEFIEQ